MLGILLALAATLQIILGLLFLPGRDPSLFPLLSPPITLALQIVVFALVGSYLYWLGNNQRTRLLGCVLLVTASAFAFKSAGSHSTTTWLIYFPLDAFLPHLLWQFTGVFPSRSSLREQGHFAQLIQHATLYFGIGIFVANGIAVQTESLQLLDRSNPDSWYGYLVYLLAGASILRILARSKYTSPDERKRVRFFIIGLTIPGSVLCLVTVLSFIPEINAYTLSDEGRLVTIPILHVMLLWIPLATAYAVAVERTVQVRQLLNMVARYWLPRTVSAGAYSVPLVAGVSLLWTNRAVPMEQMALSTSGLLALAFFLVAWIAFLLKNRVRTAINATFFRDDYDAAVNAILVKESLTHAKTLSATVQSIKSEIQQTLHPTRVHIMLRFSNEWRDPDNVLAPLNLNEVMFWHLKERPQLAIALEAMVSSESHAWLADARAELLVPVNDSQGRLLSVIVLGEKNSQLPYSEQDQTYLTTAFSLAAPYLQRWTAQRPSQTDTENQTLANHCSGCGIITSHFDPSCNQCGAEVATLNLPIRISDRYDLQAKLGSGSMGIAIQAYDSRLSRKVVLKTLPHLHTQTVRLLRQEARTMASLQHPNLTAIYDVESWRGMPILVMELLEGGTLEKKPKPFTVQETIRLGLDLYSACEFLHGQGVIHSDIKPSNIGYDKSGNAKLLDFGFAEGGGIGNEASSYLAGTPKYLPPETFAGKEPGEQRDLWALALTMYEYLTGQHPFEQSNLRATINSIVATDGAWMEDTSDDLPDEVTHFFSLALNHNPEMRPMNASAYHELLRVSETTHEM